MSQTLKKILYVEDEPDIQTVASMALTAGGFDVECYSSGEEALKRIPLYKPDLILLDVMMPGMDGPTTLKKIRENPESKDIPIIFMTAKVQAKEVEHYKQIGGMDVIAKPFDPMLLSQTIQEIWNRRG